GALRGHQPAPDLQRDQLGGTPQRVAPPAAAPRDEVEHVAGPDRNVVDLAGQDLAGAVGPVDPLAAPLPRPPAVHAPRVGEPAVVVDRDRARLLEAVRHVHAVAAAVQPGAAGVGDGLPPLDAQRVVRLQVLAGDV